MPSPVGDLNLLRAFLAVADARSFTAAAERLHIARPQVSLQIRRLENVLGAALFHRTTRTVTLTDAGQRLFEESAPLMQGLEQVLQHAGSRGSGLRGRLRVSAPVEYAVQVMSPVVAEFAVRHPEVSLELVVSDKVQDLVGEGIDVSIRVGWLRNSSARVAKLGGIWAGGPGVTRVSGPLSASGGSRGPGASPVDRADLAAGAPHMVIHQRDKGHHGAHGAQAAHRFRCRLARLAAQWRRRFGWQFASLGE